MSRGLGGSSRLGRRTDRRTRSPLVPLLRRCNNTAGAQGGLAGCTTVRHDRRTTEICSTRRAPSGRHARPNCQGTRPCPVCSRPARTPEADEHHTGAGPVCLVKAQRPTHRLTPRENRSRLAPQNPTCPARLAQPAFLPDRINPPESQFSTTKASSQAPG